MNKESIRKLEEILGSAYGNTTSLIVQQKGKKVYENYFNGYNAADPIHIFSVTKSIFSALIGIAIDKGYIKNVNQKILDFFPDYTVKQDEKIIQTLTIKNLLTMTAPYKFTTEPYEEFMASANWVKTALDLLGGEKHTGEFLYSPIIGTHILSGILANALNQPILDFARENFFSPLGINIQKNVVFHTKEEQIAWYSEKQQFSGWVCDPQGLNTASWGLVITPEDMIKIGQLYLNNGRWEDKQILSTKWIEESTKTHSSWEDMHYGYLWWILDDNHSFAAIGDGGNVIYVNREKQLVISIASIFIPDAKDRIELIKKHIEPIL
jgi:CubicO group peptidase (beta-lactamase class C family)